MDITIWVRSLFFLPSTCSLLTPVSGSNTQAIRAFPRNRHFRQIRWEADKVSGIFC